MTAAIKLQEDAMRCIVCIKQVPDTSEIRIDPVRNTILRQGVDSILNPHDLHAIEEAVRIKESMGATVTVISMGPPQTSAALREAIAMGADEAFLVSDRKFSGADTWATAVTLAGAIKHLGGADLILCGKQAIDGDTAQVGPSVAGQLGIPQMTYVRKIRELNPGSITVESLLDNGFAVVRSELPALLTVVKAINTPRFTSLKRWRTARKTDVRAIDREMLGLDENAVGLAGSLTRVVKMKGVSYAKKVKMLSGDADHVAGQLLSVLRETKDKAPEAETNLTQTTGEIDPTRWIMVIGEMRDNKVLDVTRELLGAAKRLAAKRNAQTAVVFAGCGLSDDVSEFKALDVHDAYLLDHPCLKFYEAESHARAISSLMAETTPEIILGGATTVGRALLPRIAVTLGTGLTADCTHLDIDPETGLLLQTRPAFGGNILATITCADSRPQMATVRPHVMPVEPQGRRFFGKKLGKNFCSPLTRKGDNTEQSFHDKPAKSASLPPCASEDGVIRPRLHNVPVDVEKMGRRAEVLEVTFSEHSEEDIGNAPVIITGGKGVGGRDGFELLTRLAHNIKGAVGASRSAVDAGWAGYSQQVGQTGKTVQPDIYFACGVSGAVQHLVGMQSSATVIAINKDPDAPIFKVADYGFVGDYKDVVKKLIALTRESS